MLSIIVTVLNPVVFCLKNKQSKGLFLSSDFKHFYADIHGLQRLNPANFGDAVTFHSWHHVVDICGSQRSISTATGWIVMKFGSDISDCHVRSVLF